MIDRSESDRRPNRNDHPKKETNRRLSDQTDRSLGALEQRGRAAARRAGVIGSSLIVGVLVGYLLLAAVGVYGLGMEPPQEDPEIRQAAEGHIKSSAVGIYVSEGRGGSMSPTIEPGATAVCLGGLPISEGDIVVVDGEAAKGLEGATDVRHRVVEDRGDEVVTKGDGNSFRDDPVDREAVRCRVIWAEGAGFNP